MKKYIKEFGCYLIVGFLFWYCWLIVADSVSIKDGIISALERCLNIIIPSLFAVMAVCGIIVKSGAYRVMSAPFGFIAKYLLSMPGELFSIFLISNVAGYPVGAKLICELLDNGCVDEDSASTAICFCFSAGPAFISGTVGLALFGDARIGMIVFLACFISNLMISVVLCRIKKPSVLNRDKRLGFSSEIMTDSVLSAGKSLAEICMLILFFSTVMSVLAHYRILTGIGRIFGISDAEALLGSVIEISNITAIQDTSYAFIPVISGICSFGGLCVLIQIITIVKNRFSLKLFLLTRPIVSLLSVLNSIWLSKLLLPDSIAVISSSQRIFVKVNNFIPSVCLILMIFMLKLKKRVAFSK